MPGRVLSVFLLVVGLAGPGSTSALSQELAARGPRFLAAWMPAGTLLDASRAAPLRRRVTIDLTGASVSEALKVVVSRAGLYMAFNPALLPTARTVSLHAQDITVAAALTEVLLDAGLDVTVSRGGQLALSARMTALTAPADSGDIVGTVRDRADGGPIVGATVTVEGTALSTTTDAEGRFRIAGVAPGKHVVTVRYIGYSPATVATEVVSGQEMAVELGLEKSAQQLEELVTTTPGGMQSQVKALPSPVTVITAEDIERQRPQTLNEIFRQAVPSAVGFEVPGTSGLTAFSLRGTSTLSTGGGQVKILVDGVQTATTGAAPVDPASIERIEVIRGPQAATLYGPDAAGGVIQIFTKHGTNGLNNPSILVQADVGVQQTPYEGSSRVARQSYRLSVHGGSNETTYNFGATYWRLPDWLPHDQPSSESVPSFFGGVHYDHGIFSLGLSGRYQVTNDRNLFNPAFFETGLAVLSRPFLDALKHTNQSIAAQLGVSPISWWQNRLTVGVDQYDFDQAQEGPQLVTPADTFFRVGTSSSSRAFTSFSSSLHWMPVSALSGTLTAGVDYYRLSASDAGAFGALNTAGTIELGPDGVFNVGRSVQNNTGYFAQVEAGLRESFFLTAGIRGDRNSTLGRDFGTAVSPRIGLTYVREFRGATVKTRASYGRAIRAPGAGQAARYVSSSGTLTLANPFLAPQRQRGWDAGFDVILGSRGSLSLTAYDQTADDLIVYVTVASTPTLTYQYQNVGRVKNRGFELEGSWNPRRELQLGAQFGYTQSEIRDLGPTFTGDEQVGDQPRHVPTYTAGGTMTLTPWAGTTLTGGATYVGAFREYDNLALFRCFGGTGPCQPASRDYIVNYPGFIKVSATLSQAITTQLTGFISAKNLTNNIAYEGLNNYAVLGRLTTLGLQLRY